MLQLDTPRLILRAMTPDDAVALQSIWGDEETMRFYPRALTASEIDDWLARQIGRYPSGTGLLGMILKEEPAKLIGDCGPVWQEIDGPPEMEIGYHVHRDYWNRGLATEAVRAVRGYAFDVLGCDHVISMIRPENLPSRRVAEKNGLAVDRTLIWRCYVHCVYRLAKAAAL